MSRERSYWLDAEAERFRADTPPPGALAPVRLAAEPQSLAEAVLEGLEEAAPAHDAADQAMRLVAAVSSAR